MWACLFFVLVFRTAVLASPPNPTNVTFNSVNLRNILKWSSGKDTPADTKYRVRYITYGGKHWRPVLHCTDITRTWCDLSEETSDLEDGYYAKVRAVSRKSHSEWVWTHRKFEPKSDTEFGPPHVSVEVDDKHVVVTIEGPMRYLTHNKTPQVSMATVYHHMIYNLFINNTRSGQVRHFPLTSNQYKYRTSDPATELCFSATTQLRHMTAKHHSSAWHCITTPEVQLIDRLERIVIISTTVPVVLLCLLTVGSYILYKYLSGKDQKRPDNLTIPTFFPPPLPMPSENVNIIVMPFPKDDVPINKLYPKLPGPRPASHRREAPALVDVQGFLEVDYGFVSPNDARRGNEKDQDYKGKAWEIVAASSGSTYASQGSFLQPSVSAVNNQSRESLQGLSLGENVETGSLQEQLVQETERTNENNGGNVFRLGYALQNVNPTQPSNQLHALPDDYGFVSSTGYATQNARSMQAINQSDFLSDSYGPVGLTAAQEAEGCLQIDWSPSTQRLIIPGLDLGIKQLEGEGESPPKNIVNLGTVFVRQPSEEEALLGAERVGSGQWDTEDFMAKWNLVLSNDEHI